MKNFKTLQAGHYYRDAMGSVVQTEIHTIDPSLFRSTRGNVAYQPNGDVALGGSCNYRLIEEVTITPVEAWGEEGEEK